MVLTPSERSWGQRARGLSHIQAHGTDLLFYVLKTADKGQNSKLSADLGNSRNCGPSPAAATHLQSFGSWESERPHSTHIALVWEKAEVRFRGGLCLGAFP